MNYNSKLKNGKNSTQSLFTLLSIIGMVVSVFSIAPGITKAAPDSTLYFNPASDSVALDTDFSLDAMIDSGTNQVSSAELHVTFDPLEVRLDSITKASEPATEQACRDNPVFSTTLDYADIDNVAGTASITLGVCMVPNPPAPVIVPTVVATFNFHAISTVVDSPIDFTVDSVATAIGELWNVVATRTGALITVTSVDVTPPTITSVSSDKAGGTYGVGEVIDIDVTFSEAVTSTGNVTVTLETGATDRTCTFTVSNATTGTCNYTVQAGDTSADLDTNSIAGTIKDQSDNLMVDFTPATNLAANEALVIDATPPTITSVSSDKAAGTYGTGEVIDIDVTFSEAVTSTGDVTVTLETGGTDRTCTFQVNNSASGTCNYTVQAGDDSLDLDTNSIAGTIADQIGSAMTDFTPATNLAANEALVIEATAPTITSVSSDKAGGSYTTGEVIDIDVTFSEAVTSTGDVTVTLETGGTDRTCTFQVNNASTGTCNYTVQAGDTSADLDTNSIAGTIADQIGNPMTDFTPTTNLAANEALVIDTVAPTITAVSSNTAAGSYNAGEVIDIDVTFSEAVTSTGDVTVTLETGVTDRTCTFTVTNATTGTCNYTVQAGDTSADLDTNLIAGTIADQTTNPMADFSPATNLAANEALVIDTTDPVISVISEVTPDPTTDSTPDYVFTSSEGGTIVYGGSCAAGNTVASSGENTATFGALSDGDYADCTIALQDDAGNSSNTLSVGSFTVDADVPVLSGASPSGELADGTTTATLLVTTDEAATCKFGITPNTEYDLIANTFTTTGGTTHSYALSGLTDGTTFVYYVRCQDVNTNVNPTDYTISFSVDEEEKKAEVKKRRIGNTPKTVKRGKVMIEYGKRFSKNSKVAVYFSKADGTYYKPRIVKTDQKGSFSLGYYVPMSKTVGKYKWYAVDLKTGWKSDVRSYRVK